MRPPRPPRTPPGGSLPSFPPRYSRVVRARPVVFAAVALAVAGCGASAPSAYEAHGTAKCLRKAGYEVTTDTSKLGLIPATAARGALRATEPGNNVTISFGADDAEAARIVKGYKRVQPKSMHGRIGDLLETQKNAVLLWGVMTPPQVELNKVLGCLEG